MRYRCWHADPFPRCSVWERPIRKRNFPVLARQIPLDLEDAFLAAAAGKKTDLSLGSEDADTVESQTSQGADRQVLGVSCWTFRTRLEAGTQGSATAWLKSDGQMHGTLEYPVGIGGRLLVPDSPLKGQRK